MLARKMQSSYRKTEEWIESVTGRHWKDSIKEEIEMADHIARTQDDRSTKVYEMVPTRYREKERPVKEKMGRWL